MTSVQALREFINQRLTAAAGDIFTVFQQTIVQYEEEIDRQRRLLEIRWKPEIKTKNAEHFVASELLHQHVGADEQEFHQETNFSLEQEEPQSPQIKEEQEEPEPSYIKEEQEGVEAVELCTSPEGEQLVMKFETDAFAMTSEPDGETPLHDSVVVQSHILTDERPGLSGSTSDAELQLNRGRHSDKSPATGRPSDGIRLLSCETCGERFQKQCLLMRHLRTHTGEKPYACETCSKRFSRQDSLLVHMRTHTGEKPYACETCGKSFRQHSTLSAHMRTHTGEKPYSCDICGKTFNAQSTMLCHMKAHMEKSEF
ncbi:zinc finger protein 449-like [Salarias fasciatus]|uniref:zinc finger protein 449-like n=1 Tax=Salarias fasciatus TaxID=181472 RepID=UPI0011770140|nr:zinc finger protein 449-like [Salarias fasciatus]